MDLTAGVDIGATQVRVALGDESGKILAKITEPSTRARSKAALGEQIESCISRLLGKQGASGLKRVGLATTGPLDRRGGITNPANFPKMGFIPLVRPLLDWFGGEVVLINDCSAAAVAEREVGAGRGFDSFVYLTFSTGIGAGVFVDGHLLVGKDGNAHEVGHMVIDCGGRLVCGCGKPGHWEAYCSGQSIPKLASLILDTEEARRVGALTSAEVFRGARSGDLSCYKVVQEVGRLNAIGVASVVDVYDPELIVVGGSVALSNPEEVLGPIRDGVRNFARNRVPQVRLTEHGADVVLSGALLSALLVDDYPELRPWSYSSARKFGRRR
jgi:glucokinase